jgi:DNA-binding transcriptional regulator YhcF (GntR family)
VSGLPELVVVTADPTPPYEQLRRQLAGLIRSGTLPAGSRLPPLRQLAGDLGLAVGTVARTYRELETDGLIVSRRGGGTRVAEAAADRTPMDRSAVLHGAAAEFVRHARAAGADPAEIITAVRQALDAPDQAGRRRLDGTLTADS